MNKTSLILFGVFFLTLGALTLSAPKKAYSGIPFSLGCCLEVNGTSNCLGCGEFGEDCAVPQRMCLADLNGDNFVGGGYCNDGPSGAICVEGGSTPGCCVLENGLCDDGTTVSSCGGDLWFAGAECSEVLQCTQRETVPAMSKWGVVAMAGILGIVGFIVIRKRMASV